MKQPVEAFYDWIVFGDHLAGLWFSSVLASAGLKIAVIPTLTDSNLSGNHLREPNWFPDFLELPGLDSAHDIQVLTPDRRFRLQRERDALDREFKETFGSKIGLSDYDHPRLKDFVRGMAFLFRNHDYGAVLADDWDWVLKFAPRQRYCSEGRHGARRRWVKEAEKLGVRILEDHRCQKIFIDRKGFKGVQLLGSSSVITGSAALLTVNWDWIQNLFSDPDGSDRGSAFDRGFRSDPLGWWYTFEFEMPTESIPDSVSTKMVFSEAGSPSVEIERIASRRSDGSELWLARTLLPFQSFTLGREYQLKVAQRLFCLLQTIFPFIEYSATRLHPDIRDPERVESVDLVKLYPFRDLAHVPHALLAYGPSRRGKNLGNRSPVPNCFLAYPESFPRFGEWGVYHAAAVSALEWAKKNQKELPIAIRQGLVKLISI